MRVAARVVVPGQGRESTVTKRFPEELTRGHERSGSGAHAEHAISQHLSLRIERQHPEPFLSPAHATGMEISDGLERRTDHGDACRRTSSRAWNNSGMMTNRTASRSDRPYSRRWAGPPKMRWPISPACLKQIPGLICGGCIEQGSNELGVGHGFRAVDGDRFCRSILQRLGRRVPRLHIGLLYMKKPRECRAGEGWDGGAISRDRREAGWDSSSFTSRPARVGIMGASRKRKGQPEWLALVPSFL